MSAAIKAKNSSLNHTEGEGHVSSKASVDDILNFIGFGPLQIIAYFLAGLTSLAFGFETLTFVFIEIPVQKEWNLTSLQYAVIPSIAGATSIWEDFFMVL